MRILVAPDSFGGTLSARAAAQEMAHGWAAGAPHDEVRTLPLADGGPGFLEVVHAARGGDLVPVMVTGPLGEPAPAAVLLVHGDRTTTAYVESAHAVGLHLLEATLRDPTQTTSVGVGELVRAAVGAGAQRVVVGIGGTATNDGGAGMLAGLGLASPTLRRGGGALAGLEPADLDGLVDLVRELAGIDLVVAADVDVPLLGLHGASAGFAEQKGASPQQAQDLERALGQLAHLVGESRRALPAPDQTSARRDLLRGPVQPQALAQVAGAGSGGGLGFGLLALGARVLPGADVVADAVDLDAAVAEADLVVTGEGTLDWQSLHGKVVAAVARVGLRHGVPVVAVAGQVHLGRREWSAAGLAGTYAVAETPDRVAEALADPHGTLRARTERVARTWSR